MLHQQRHLLAGALPVVQGALGEEHRDGVHDDDHQHGRPEELLHGAEDRVDHDPELREGPHDPQHADDAHDPQDPRDAEEHQVLRDLAGPGERELEGELGDGEDDEQEVEDVPHAVLRDEELAALRQQPEQELHEEERHEDGAQDHEGQGRLADVVVGHVLELPADEERVHHDDEEEGQVEAGALHHAEEPGVLLRLGLLEHLHRPA
mmetsp:Transcript_86230/g.279142  ORF Transcript_86230/g.279142 Transcript_86230/m.279142 type:complete len:207 (+) Transcript_86230:836-1456(+)